MLLPLVQISTQTVMADGLVALLIFWATIALIRYLETERTRYAVLVWSIRGLGDGDQAQRPRPGSAAADRDSDHPAFLPVEATRACTMRLPSLSIFGLPWDLLSYKLMASTMGPATRPLLPCRDCSLCSFTERILARQFRMGAASLLPRRDRGFSAEPAPRRCR